MIGTILIIFSLPTFLIGASPPPLDLHHESDLPPLKGKVVTGIYHEDTPNSLILYEKVAPLLFEFRLRPEFWNNFNLNFPIGVNKFKILPKLNCRSDERGVGTSLTDFQFTCPVFYHVNEFLKQFKGNNTDVHPQFRTGSTSTPTSSTPMNLRVQQQEYHQKFSPNPTLKFEDCEQIIARSWRGIYGRDMGLSEYKAILEKCNTLPNYFEDGILDYAGDTSYSQIFESMRDNFISTYLTNVTSTMDPVSPGGVVSALLAMQGMHLVSNYAEINRLNDAIHACRNHLIPYSILKSSRLEKALQDIRNRLSPLKYAIPSSLTNLHKLLKLPLADCIFGPTTLTVQILMPVIRLESLTSYSLMKFTYPKFLYEDNLCSVQSVGDLPSDLQPRYFLYDRASGRTLIPADSCVASSQPFCHLPEPPQLPLVNKCIYNLLNATFDSLNVRDYCKFHCEPLTGPSKPLTIPLIQRVSPTRFLISVDRVTSILVKCEGKPDSMITPQKYGAVEVTLPCNCYIMYHDDKYYARAPCGNSLFIHHVIPEHMVNMTYFKDQQGLESRYNLKEPLAKVNFSMFNDDPQQDNNEESDDVHLVNLTEITSQIYSTHRALNNNDDPSYNNDCFKGHLYLWIFVLFQSIMFVGALTFLILRLNFLTKQYEYGRGAVSFSVSQMTNLDENK